MKNKLDKSADLSFKKLKGSGVRDNPWINLKIPLNNLILNDEVLQMALTEFWSKVMSKLSDNTFILILFRMEYDNDLIFTLGPPSKINKHNFEALLKSYITLLQIKDDRYKNTPLKSIIISHKIIPEDKLLSKNSKIFNPEIKPKKPRFFTFFGYSLPTTTNFKQWGEIISQTNRTVSIRKFNSSLIYVIHITDAKGKDTLKKHLVFIMKNGKVILTFEDTIPDKSIPDTFSRKIIEKSGHQEYHFKDGKLVLKLMDRLTSYLKNIKTDKKITRKFITMDLESRQINNVVKPYLLAFYDGVHSYSFYLHDYKNIESMIKAAFTHLLKSKYDQHKVYLHNLSYFDGVFMLKILDSLPNSSLSINRHEGRLINLQLTFKSQTGKQNYHLHFRDSLLLLPVKLKYLATSFNVLSKGLFPIFAANDLPLDYVGAVPAFKYFEGISLGEYIKYVATFNLKHGKQNWSLKEQSVQYCIQDCISLYQVLDKFNDLMFDRYQLNINKFSTLSSLAFGIFRAHFLKDSKIPLITGQILSDIRQGYFGGATDMYLPSGNTIFTYDVNSLYPFVMANFPMPIGKIRFFEGNILDIMKKPFGFFEVEITTPTDLKIPIILTRVTKKGQTSTMAPLGAWKDVIFSEEMFNAMNNFGYTFKVVRGYLFEHDFIFKDYVNSLYEIKSTTAKDDPMYLISKLLLNTLYGKFGMREEVFFTQHQIVSDDELFKMIDFNMILDTTPLHEDRQLISFISDKTKDIDHKLNNLHQNLNISIGLSAAITAYARIHMSQFKHSNCDFNILYTDTDSISIDKPLPDNLVDAKKLGKMKLENIFQKSVYLGPKMYGGLYDTFIVDKDGNCKAAITKVKGYKDIVSFDTLDNLLNIKDNNIQKTELSHEKWFRDFSKVEILVKEQIYTLTPTQNKRELIIHNNKIVDTKPYTINNNKDNIITSPETMNESAPSDGSNIIDQQKHQSTSMAPL